MTYRLQTINNTGTIMLVGCGGTGGFVAEGLCRLLIGRRHRLYLVDHDRVEEPNLGRQNFIKADLGHFKAEVLARRLAAAYGRQIEYLIRPIEQLALEDRGDLTIGCVDNARARRRLQYAGRYTMGGYYSYCRYGGWYIDAGNGEYSGQVLIGNGLLTNLGHSFNPASGTCSTLPLPTIQQPALLAPAPKKRRAVDCAEAIAADEQSPVINQAMAALVLTFVHKLLTGSLDWMGAYLDLASGNLTTVPATPEAVSRLTGLSVNLLIEKVKKQ